jgi:drug/metabolite transporter (DMT)-like permease
MRSVLMATLIAWCGCLVWGFNLGNGSRGLLMTLAAGCFEGLYFYALVKALERAPLALAYSSMRSGSMVLSWPLAWLFLGESLNVMGGIACLLILAGLTLPFWLRFFGGYTRHANSTHSLQWSYLCGVLITGYNFFYHQSMQWGANATSVFALSLTVALPFLWFTLPQPSRSLRWKNFLTTLTTGTGIIIFLSFTFFLLGLKATPPAMAVSLRNSSIIFALLFSYGMGERLKQQEWYTLIFLIAGILLLTLLPLFNT